MNNKISLTKNFDQTLEISVKNVATDNRGAKCTLFCQIKRFFNNYYGSIIFLVLLFLLIVNMFQYCSIAGDLEQIKLKNRVLEEFLEQITQKNIFLNENFLFSLNKKRSIRNKSSSLKFTGIQPCVCPDGQKGEKGEPGYNGLPGPVGLTGYKGSKGDQGIKGDKGGHGQTGVQGIKGEKGEAVIIKQENGIIGPRGLPGIPGTKGEKGQSGFLSLKMSEDGSCDCFNESNGAREAIDLSEIKNLIVIKGQCIILQKNNCGPSLPGPPGPKGEKGESGLDGIKGSKGERGRPGRKGEKGTRGYDGLDAPSLMASNIHQS